MPSKPAGNRRQTRPPTEPPAKQKATPLLDRSDVRRILGDLTRDLAPGDVETLMQNETELRRRIAQITDPDLAVFRRQLTLATDCLRDHVDGECPQIPYYTISLLGAALLYFGDELDAVPDFLPQVGKLDDASVMAIACELGADGIKRYCAATDRSLKGILPTPQPRRP